MDERTRYTLRPILPADEPFLWEILYHALFVEEGQAPLPRGIVRDPQIARYVRGWGREGDRGFVAVDALFQQPVGAVWCRVLRGGEKGFAYLGDETPELTIALLPAYRGKGIGTALLKRLFEETKGKYQALSLSVSPNNPAKRLYERLGFRVVAMQGTHPVMAVRLGEHQHG